MKKAVYCLILFAIVPTIVSAQTQTRQRLSDDQTTNQTSAARTRVVGPRVANHVEGPKVRANASADNGAGARSNTFTWGNIPIVEQPKRAPAAPAIKTSATTSEPVTAKPIQSTVIAATGPTEMPNSRVPSAPRSVSPSTYIVGSGDVLDISLGNTATRESTLFTVFKNGTIEYPLLNGPVAVAGLTTEQIGSLLAGQIRVIRAPKVNVSVRDYASHTVVLTGMVDSGGKKILRRESMPLYAILAEASVRPEASTVTITHNGKEGTALSLKDETAMSTLIYSGDTVKVSGGGAGASQYVYVGGDVAAPGEKTLRAGMTLTQVLLSAGADLSTRRVAKIARRDANGLLSTVEYDIKAIAQGKTPDPQIVAGDRVEVKRGM